MRENATSLGPSFRVHHLHIIRFIRLSLGGHVIQNWCLLRILPLIIGDKIKRPLDPVWQLCLQLREIVELVCSPHISTEQVAYIKVVADEYLEERKVTFSECKLRPKHHYMTHYAEMILKFGPLMRMWTMRFESKHSYFKKCLQHCQNFKNITKTLSERHQQLQAYMASGSLLTATIIYDKAIPFHPTLYSAEIISSLHSFGLNSQNSVICEKVTFKGIDFKRGLFVVVNVLNNLNITFGCIQMMIIKSCSSLYIVVQLCEGSLETHLGVYSLLGEVGCGQAPGQVLCIPVNDLLDLFPLPAYHIGRQCLIPLKHRFPNKRK